MAPERKGPAETDRPYDAATGPQAAPLHETHDPHEHEGFLHPAEVAWQAVARLLPRHSVAVKHRISDKEPQATNNGTFYQERVTYTDRTTRIATIGIPHELRSPYAISSGDPWFTGEAGFNAWKIEQLVKNGFAVIWSHHEGRNFINPTSPTHFKEFVSHITEPRLGKYAAHDHALLDHLEPYVDFDLGRVIREGYSRGAMIGEAFIATAGLHHDRKVVWSDLEAACFARGIKPWQFLPLVARQVHKEIPTIMEIGRELMEHGGLDPEDDKAAEFMAKDYLSGTLDIHFKNLIYELLWAGSLITGDAGNYAKAIPLNAKGIRTFHINDAASQEAEWRNIFRKHQGITILQEPGGHFAPAKPSNVYKKVARLVRLRQYAEEHEGNLDGITAEDVLPKVSKKHRPKPKK